MKKFLLGLSLFCSVYCIAQKKTTDYEHRIDSLMLRIDTLIQINNHLLEHLDIDLSLKDRYKLYPTQNMYTLLELDTKTGIVKQVQWGLEPEYEGTWYINSDDLNYWDGGYGSGTFELYPTQNMYQFILIDQTNGRKWHIQWGMEEKKRWIRRLY